MTYIIGGTWFLVGLATAFFIAGNSVTAWLILGVTGVAWFVLSAHLTGIRKGEKRAATDL